MAQAAADDRASALPTLPRTRRLAEVYLWLAVNSLVGAVMTLIAFAGIYALVQFAQQQHNWSLLSVSSLNAYRSGALRRIGLRAEDRAEPSGAFKSNYGRRAVVALLLPPCDHS
jgi:hypothetical protein